MRRSCVFRYFEVQKQLLGSYSNGAIHIFGTSKAFEKSKVLELCRADSARYSLSLRW